MQQPVIVFDVNETLSDLRPLEGRFTELGAPSGTAATWFAAVLRDGLALTVADARPAFAEVAREAARWLLSHAELDRPLDDAVDHVLAGLAGLGVHDDVVPGVRRLAALGFRMVTLSNGSTDVAAGLLERAGLNEEIEALYSVEENTPWKPASSAYGYAAAQAGVAPWDMVLVASHPWDVDGAARAGLRGIWVNRTGAEYPRTFTAPTAVVTDLTEVADVLAEPIA